MNSIITYSQLLSDDEKDIMQIKQYPHTISYHNYDSNRSNSSPPPNHRTPSLFVSVDTTDNQLFTKSIIYIVKKLVEEFKDVPADRFSFRHFTEGITNKLVCITDTQTNFAVNVRTYGPYTEFVIDRKQELLITEACASVTLYGTFLNGVVYSYIPGRTLTLGDLIDLDTFSQTAIAISRHHKTTPPLIQTPLLFVTLRKWLGNVPAGYINSKKKPLDFGVLKKELVFLEKILNNRSDIVLCHNDLLLKNFIKGEKKVWLIDYEYSSYNYRAFDLANHFVEWCGFECNWDNFPSKETQRRFLSIYVSHNTGKDVDDAMVVDRVNELLEDVKWFELASHYFWGVWASIEAALSSIDFGYMDYSHMRLERYFVVKERLIEEHPEIA
ncbi:ethanolamine kinase [Entamoeba marina]